MFNIFSYFNEHWELWIGRPMGAGGGGIVELEIFEDEWGRKERAIIGSSSTAIQQLKD